MTPAERAAQLVPRIHAADGGTRFLVALAGPPASGKSALAAALAAALIAAGTKAQVVAMDGFHLDNTLLAPQGLLSHKGAPETFDAAGFIAMIRRLKAEPRVFLPVFDRSSDMAIAGAAEVSPDTRVVIVEGNYLLFDQAPWRSLADYWDLSLFLEVPETILRERLVQRWRDHGLSDHDAALRADSNDLPNALRIQNHRLPADVLI